MKYGFIVSKGGPRAVADLAREAEAAGWDGVFYWDGIHIGKMDTYDPWVVMAAMAMTTQSVRLGAVLTPPARRRPWKLARETITLDHLSGGRLVLPVGLGALDDGGFSKVGEPTDRRVRAALLDESLEILTGLWSGEPFSYKSGEHYRLEEMTFLPKPVQSPRVPIWVVGAWPSERSMNRALRYDGLLAAKTGASADPTVTPEDIRAMKSYIEAHRAPATRFDIIHEGVTPGDDPEMATDIVRPFAEAGVTWWMESMWTPPNEPEDLRARIQQGPPEYNNGS